MGVREGSVEGPLCFVLLYALSVTQAQRKRPLHQRVIAVVSRADTTARLDLSDLCFVDDLVSLLIIWRKSQLSRFAEMVSQVLDSGSLRVNKSKQLTGGIGWNCRTRSASHQCRDCLQSPSVHVPGRIIRATAVVKYLGCQLEAHGHACRSTNAGIQGLQGPAR